MQLYWVNSLKTIIRYKNGSDEEKKEQKTTTMLFNELSFSCFILIFTQWSIMAKMSFEMSGYTAAQSQCKNDHGLEGTEPCCGWCRWENQQSLSNDALHGDFLEQRGEDVNKGWINIWISWS